MRDTAQAIEKYTSSVSRAQSRVVMNDDCPSGACSRAFPHTRGHHVFAQENGSIMELSQPGADSLRARPPGDKIKMQ